MLDGEDVKTSIYGEDGLNDHASFRPTTHMSQAPPQLRFFVVVVLDRSGDGKAAVRALYSAHRWPRQMHSQGDPTRNALLQFSRGIEFFVVYCCELVT